MDWDAFILNWDGGPTVLRRAQLQVGRVLGIVKRGKNCKELAPCSAPELALALRQRIQLLAPRQAWKSSVGSKGMSGSTAEHE